MKRNERELLSRVVWAETQESMWVSVQAWMCRCPHSSWLAPPKGKFKDTVKDKLGKVDCQIVSGSASTGACLCQALYWETRYEVEKDTA